MLSRGAGDEGSVVCARCNTVGVRRVQSEERETKGKGAGRDEKEGKRRGEGDNDWNKIFTAAAGAGP